MYTLIRVASGLVLEAVILQRTKRVMRIIVPEFADTLEVKRIGPDWLLESGEAVEFEFLAAMEQQARSEPTPSYKVSTAAS